MGIIGCIGGSMITSPYIFNHVEFTLKSPGIDFQGVNSNTSFLVKYNQKVKKKYPQFTLPTDRNQWLKAPLSFPKKPIPHSLSQALEHWIPLRR